MIEYTKIPDWWALCPNENCLLAETCLRQQACKQMPKEINRWKCLLPHVNQDGKCEFYQKYEKVTMAQGIDSIYNNVRTRDAHARIHADLTAYFGSKGSYQRYKEGKRLINPKMQQDIIDFVHMYEPGVEVNFDNTFEDYDFTQI